jgi:hypothetical protein
MATILEQEQPQVGSVLRHYITGTKITTFKIINI